MIEVKGAYADAKFFTDQVDDQSLAQVQTLCDQPFVAGSKIRLMPDVHAGAGCTIGTTMTITDKVVPNLVGVDIGCGMETVRLRQRDLDLAALDAFIKKHIPVGFCVRNAPHPYMEQLNLRTLRCAKSITMSRAIRSIGTLGGGNHFIEVDRDDDGNLYLVVHSGSRHPGLEVAKHYQELAWRDLAQERGQALDAAIAKLKATGRRQEIQALVADFSAKNKDLVPKALAYVSGPHLEDYLHDMRLMQRFAELNRHAMVDTLIEGLGLDVEDRFTTIHNYIDLEAKILRKGAVSARAGERLLIPINMRDGSLICVGKGNDDWNQSAPHGAGRLMSRAQAKRVFTVEAFRQSMAGIYTTTADQSTLDECPMAYKPIEAILDNIAPTADIVARLRPLYNFKAAGD